MRPLLTATLVCLLGFGLRVIGLDEVPPGWRDDEIIETTIHAQRVLDGEWPLYFVEAEGHEPLYHYVSAGWITLFGRSLWSVRMVSAIFGILALAASYRLVRQLYGRQTALVVLVLLVISFWVLMYSRTKIRHISALPFVLLSFSAWWQGVRRDRTRSLASAGIWLALGLYTYFAAFAGVLILTASSMYYVFVKRKPVRTLLQIGIMPTAIAVILYLPLLRIITNQGAGANRLAIVGAPLVALRTGNMEPALQNTIATLGMFGFRGDPEALYNIPNRPVFGPIVFVLFALGVVLLFSKWRSPRRGFVLIWLLGGIAPTFVSMPAASLGHSIVSLPAVYLVCGFAIHSIAKAVAVRTIWSKGTVWGVLSLVVIIAVGFRDLPAYFISWPRLYEVRFLYRAELQDQFQRWRTTPPTAPVAIGSTLSYWDTSVAEIELSSTGIQPRWFRPEWAAMQPEGLAPETYYFFPSEPDIPASLISSDIQTGSTATYPGLFHLRGYLLAQQENELDVYLFWAALDDFNPELPIISTSPESPLQPIKAFVHLSDTNGTLIAGADRFDLDYFTLQAGDKWVQLHRIELPQSLNAGEYSLSSGLYRTENGRRILTTTGVDTYILGRLQLPKES